MGLRPELVSQLLNKAATVQKKERIAEAFHEARDADVRGDVVKTLHKQRLQESIRELERGLPEEAKAELAKAKRPRAEDAQGSRTTSSPKRRRLVKGPRSHAAESRAKDTDGATVAVPVLPGKLLFSFAPVFPMSQVEAKAKELNCRECLCRGPIIAGGIFEGDAHLSCARRRSPASCGGVGRRRGG